MLLLSQLSFSLNDKSKFVELTEEAGIKSIIQKETSITYYVKKYMKKIEGYAKLIPSGCKPGKLYGQAKVHKSNVPLRLEWASSLVGGPYVGRQSPCRAGLLNGSSSISSTTTIVRVALIGKQKKGLHILRCPVFLRKRAKKGLHVFRYLVLYRKYR